ncbi:hypothetical protein ACERZ8_00515 [Tateyamaria armeniaca]|uniref:SnoaL-like domain-containing protein n=1 Tax=Tateyamaria armeniaca TaxID=2518930 RepID=A0ABW8UN96_9RHOB
MVAGSGPQVQHAEAMLLLQEVLDIQSRALLDGDVATMRATVNLPYRRITMDMDMIMETEADLELGMEAFTGSLRSLGVNHFIRLASDAEFLNDHIIEGHYVTHALRNATQMVPSYHNRIVLQNFDGTWRLIEVASELEAKRWPISLLRVAESGMLRTQKSEHDARRHTDHPLPVYQRFLDQLTSATVDQNFDAYIALCDLPYTSHGNNVDTLMASPEDVRPFFDLTVDLINGETADTFVRSADNAQFLGSDMICGYHKSLFLKAGETALPAIKSRMILKHTGMGWKLKHVTNAIANKTYPYGAPEPTDALPTHREIQERTKSWQTLN